MKAGAILIDPPWKYRGYSGDAGTPHRSKQDHYPTMTHKELRALPVTDLANKACALFCWVTSSHMEKAFDLFDVWGFAFRALGFVWVKTKQESAAAQGDFFLDDVLDNQHPLSMGKWTRQQTEVCLIAAKGRPRIRDHGVRQVIYAPRREHSRKPDAQYGRIERLVSGPYLEMFARQRWPGWEAFGNEVDKFRRVV